MSESLSQRESRTLSLLPESELSSDNVNESRRRKLFHPFLCRLNNVGSIETSSPSDIKQVSFACWTVGMLTVFRPAFLLLIEMSRRLRITSNNIYILEEYILIASYFWFALVVFVLFFLGFIPLFAASVKKRWALLIHPWAMLLLYFDPFVWFTITTVLFADLNELSPGAENTIKQVKYPAVYFSIIYLDILVFWIIYYVYVTFFIVAELTIIEKFY